MFSPRDGERRGVLDAAGVAMSTIELRGVTYRYDGADETGMPALDGVHLRIEQGECVAVLGANGSGKSTLARLLNGLLLPTDGSVFVDGMDTRDVDKRLCVRQCVGMVFQNPDNQIIAATVEDDVAFGAENLGVAPDEIRRRVSDALRTVRMEEFRAYAPHHLSGGQKQRVAIAGVLAMQTRCIVFDEATAMLDPVGRREVMETVRHLSEAGITIILITHFMEEAACADRIVLLGGGRIVADGTPRDILSDADLLAAQGLTMPFATSMAEKLRERGLPLADGVLYREELVESLCPSS